LTVQCVITDNQALSTITATTSFSSTNAVATLTMQPGYALPIGGLSSNGTTVSGSLIIIPTVTTLPGVSSYVANVSANCRPTAQRIVTYITGGRTWSIVINTNGNMNFTITSGSALSSGNVLPITSFSYNL
jgi:hypothetical protein